MVIKMRKIISYKDRALGFNIVGSEFEDFKVFYCRRGQDIILYIHIQDGLVLRLKNLKKESYYIDIDEFKRYSLELVTLHQIWENLEDQNSLFYCDPEKIL